MVGRGRGSGAADSQAAVHHLYLITPLNVACAEATSRILTRNTTPPSLLASSISWISVSLRASLCKFRSNSLLIRVAESQIHGHEWRSVFVKYKIQSTSRLTTFRC